MPPRRRRRPPGEKHLVVYADDALAAWGFGPRDLPGFAKAWRSQPAPSVPWLHWLPDDERWSCINELVLELDAGAATGNLEPFARSLRAWRSTAEVWSDPELARRLSLGFGGDGPVLDRRAAQ
jgi:hypothetical protein